MELYHIIKLTTTMDNNIVSSQMITKYPQTKQAAIRIFLLKLADKMRWPRSFAGKLCLDIQPTRTDLEEVIAINWQPRLLMPKSQLRWAMWKLKIDGIYTVPTPEPGDDYGVQTYILSSYK